MKPHRSPGSVTLSKCPNSRGRCKQRPSRVADNAVPLLEGSCLQLPSRGCAASGAAWESTSRGDAVIELTKFVFETLRQGEEFALRRGRRDDGKLPTILVVAPFSEYPALSGLSTNMPFVRPGNR